MRLRGYPPTFVETVTIAHHYRSQGEDVWTVTVVERCAWTVETVRAVTNETVQVGQSVICRIPRSIEIVPGDYLFRGSISDPITGSTISALYRRHKPDAACVKAVKYNLCGSGAPHIKVVGV